MKYTEKQRNELEVWRYFIPDNVAWEAENDNDIMKFFEWSQAGKHKNAHYGDRSYFEALRQGKSWAGVHAEMYEEGILDGSMPYVEILRGAPRAVINFLKKEMFKGADAEIIESVYQHTCTQS